MSLKDTESEYIFEILIKCMMASTIRAIAPLERSRPVLFTLFHHVEPIVLGMSFKRQLNKDFILALSCISWGTD